MFVNIVNERSILYIKYNNNNSYKNNNNNNNKSNNVRYETGCLNIFICYNNFQSTEYILYCKPLSIVCFVFFVCQEHEIKIIIIIIIRVIIIFTVQNAFIHFGRGKEHKIQPIRE